MMMTIKNNKEELYKLLYSLGLKKIRPSSNGFTCCCPFHDDKKPSFSISNEGLWICFACGEKGNLRQLLKKLGKLEGDYKDNLKIIELMMKQPEEKELKSDKEFYYKPYKNIKDIPQYLLNRLKPETIFFFRLGYNNEFKRLKNRIIIPVFYKEKLVAYNARSIDDNTIPKYINPLDINIKDYLFNYDNIEKGKPVLIVEGAFNCMSAWEKGFKNTVATFGTSVSDKQIDLLTKLNPPYFIIGFDNDSNQAGNIAAEKLNNVLKDFYEVYRLILPVDRDINDISKEEFENALKNIQKIS
jgi:DNA primase